jgi:hypothetical protein
MKVKELFEAEIKDKYLIYDEDIKNGKIYNNEYSKLNVNKTFDCSWCVNLTSLEGVPNSITGDFIFNNCESLTSLEEAPTSVIGDVIGFQCYKITSLEGIGKDYLELIDGDIFISHTICENILGLLKIQKLRYVDLLGYNKEPLNTAIGIINNHLTSGRRLSKCREELIEAGLKEFAKL